MKIIKPSSIGAICAITSGLCYGLLGYFGMTLINDGLSIYNMSFWRYLFSSIFMFVLMIPKLRTVSLNRRESIKVLIYGIALYSPGSMVYFWACKYIGSGLAMVIFFTYPAMVMLIDKILYKTQFSKIYYLSIVIILAGLVLLTDWNDLKFDAFGIILSLISSLFYAFYIIVSKNNESPPFESTIIVTTGSAITCLILAVIDGSFSVPTGLTNWLNIVGIGVICTGIPILLMLKSLEYLSSVKVSILSVLEPVFVLLFGIILLHESINTLQFVGVITLLSGALLSLTCNKPDSQSFNSKINPEPQKMYNKID